MTKIVLQNKETKEARIVTIEQAAEEMTLSLEELENTLEEHGRCDTDTHVAWEHEDGSVVREVYKQRYKENGNPKGCNDSLHLWFDENSKGEDGKTDVAWLLSFAANNEIDGEKYVKETNGWQGRMRMTIGNIVRNRLKKGEPIFDTNGKELAI